MKNDGPRLPEGAQCSQWKGVSIQPPLRKADTGSCNSCIKIAPTWCLQFPGFSLRLCDKCYVKLQEEMARFRPPATDNYTRHCLQVDCTNPDLECQECPVWIKAGRPKLED